MDSIKLPPAAPVPKDNSSNSKMASFLKTYRPQEWSLPGTLVHYIAKNAANPEVYEKIIKNCKYFFLKNPVLLVRILNLKFKDNKWCAYINGKPVAFNNLTSKIWVTEMLNVDRHGGNATAPTPNSFAAILPKIYGSDIKELKILKQNIFFKDLAFLGSKCENVWLDDLSVMDEEGSLVAVETIFGIFPHINDFRYFLGDTSTKVATTKTFKEIIDYPHFKNLDIFMLTNIREAVDIDILYNYIKKNKKTTIAVKFGHQISEEYQSRLQTIVNEILATENIDFKPPLITFPGMLQPTYNALFTLYFLN